MNTMGRKPPGIRLGLCCIFREVPIKFRTTTARVMLKLEPAVRLQRLSELCMENATALAHALAWCADHGIGGFRINSQILPLKTHPDAGYRVEDLPQADAIREAFTRCGRFARKNGMRLSFHPDQFVVLNSPRPDVVRSSIDELEYQAMVAEWVGADVVNIHGGGAYGDKRAALKRLIQGLDRLTDRVRRRLTLENDDRTYTPTDLLPVCRTAGLPLCYDVHHHRCLPDSLTVDACTEAVLDTWNREPLFHLSSPIEGWDGPDPRRHHDFIQAADFPAAWSKLAITIEIEAKAKERAIEQFRQDLLSAGIPCIAHRAM